MINADKFKEQLKLLERFNKYREDCYRDGKEMSSRDLANSLDSDRAYNIGLTEGKCEGFALAMLMLETEGLLSLEDV